MAWPVVAAMAAMGAIQGEQQRKAQQQANRQQAEVAAAQTEYSPWTGIKPQGVNFSPVTSSAMGGAAQGALSGAMMGKGGFGSMGGDGGTTAKLADISPQQMSDYASMGPEQQRLRQMKLGSLS